MDPVICITHAAFDERRRWALQRLMQQLRLEAPDIQVRVAMDQERRGSLWCWRHAMKLGLDVLEATHIIGLPDDAVVCRDFGRIIRACIEARPTDVFDCSVNHSLLDWRKGTDGKPSVDLKAMWYSAADGGLTLHGGVFPRDALAEHLAWRDRVELRDSYTNDGGVNLWGMATGRRLFKTAFTLVTQDTDLPSLDGNDEHEYRQGLRWLDDFRSGIWEDVENLLLRTWGANDEVTPGARRSCALFPRTYSGNHWALALDLPPSEWNVARMYELHNAPTQETGKPRVVMLVPVYRELEEVLRKTRPARIAIRDDLEAHGISCAIIDTPGDSHVDRMRQRATHMALKGGATHIVWCDADIEPMDPTCVRRMLETGHDVIAGACPFRSAESKGVVVNLFDAERSRLEAGEGLEVVKGCIPVQDIGTGFMMVSAKALYALMEAHPDRLHTSRSRDDHGEPLWALWDATVVDRTFLTEDYHFCRLWQRHGGTVYMHIPSTFRHWGLHGFEGSFAEQWGLMRA